MVFVHFHGKKKNVFLLSSWSFPCFNLCPLPLGLLLCVSKRSLASSSLCLPIRYLQTAIRSPLSLLFSTLNTALCAPAPWPAWWNLLDLLQHVPIFLVLNRPKLDTVLQTWSRKCQMERKDYFSGPACYTFSNAAQDVVGCLCCKGTLLIHVQLVVHHAPWGPFLKSC